MTQIDYVSRKEGGRGLSRIVDCKNSSIQGLEDNIKMGKERLIQAANNSTGDMSSERRTTKTRKPKWEEKQLYGYFK